MNITTTRPTGDPYRRQFIATLIEAGIQVLKARKGKEKRAS